MDPKEAWQIRKRGYEIMAARRARDLRLLSHEDWIQTLDIVWSVREPDQRIFTTALWIQRALKSVVGNFCFIGGLALQRWGEVRVTQGVDLMILCPLGDEMDLVEKLRTILTPRDEDVESLARITRMFLGVAPDGIKVDISLGFMPYETRVMERSVDVEFELAEPLRCCSAEDLAIMKAVAGRDRDWADIRTIVHRSGPDIDWDMVFSELKILLELSENPEHEQRLREIVEEES